jgi:hypothetical protein
VRRAAALFLLAVSLGACAQLEWAKPEVAPAQVQKDSADCREAAWREASARYFWYSPWYYPPFGYARDPRVRFATLPGGYYGDRLYEEDRLTRFCMQAKGYQLVPVEEGKQ